jgi:dihydrofolate reductase
MATIYYTACSLDGFLATEEDSIEWLHALGAIGETGYETFIANVGALCMGAATYEWMRGHDAEVCAAVGSPWPYTQPAWIFTHRALPRITDDASLTFVHGDVRPVHEAMVQAARGRDVWIVGGGDLAAQFHDAGLLDEVILQIGSVTLGHGKPLFPRRVTDPSWTLHSARRVGPGFAELRYRVRSSD